MQVRVTDGSKSGTPNPVVPQVSANKVVTIAVVDSNDEPYFWSPWTVELFENSMVVGSALSVRSGTCVGCVLCWHSSPTVVSFVPHRCLSKIQILSATRSGDNCSTAQQALSSRLLPIVTGVPVSTSGLDKDPWTMKQIGWQQVTHTQRLWK